MRTAGFLLVFLAVMARADVFETAARQRQAEIDRALEKGQSARARDLRLSLARDSAKQGLYAEAARQYELLLAARPRKAERVKLFTELGRLREMVNDDAGAVQAYGDALHDDPKAWDANFLIGGAYLRMNEPLKAQAHFHSCISLDGKNAAAWAGLGDALAARGSFPEAIAAYQKSVALQPSGDVFIRLAQAHSYRGDLPRAIETLRSAKASGVPGDFDAAAGYLYRRHGDVLQAISDWQTALAADPNRLDVQISLIWLLGSVGRWKDAEAMARNAGHQAPQSALLEFTWAWLRLRQGDPVGARRHALAARSLSPSPLVNRYNERLIRELNP